MTTTAASATAAAKRETLAALTAAGFAVAKILASATRVQVTLADEADVPAVLRMYPGAVSVFPESVSSTTRRTVSIPR